MINKTDTTSVENNSVKNWVGTDFCDYCEGDEEYSIDGFPRPKTVKTYDSWGSMILCFVDRILDGETIHIRGLQSAKLVGGGVREKLPTNGIMVVESDNNYDFYFSVERKELN